MTSLDLEFIKERMNEIITGSLTGSLEYFNVEATVSLPGPVVEILRHIAETQGVSFDKMVSKAASEGINSYMKQIQSMAGLPVSGVKKEEPVQIPTSITDKFDELKEMMNKISGLTEQVQILEKSLKEE
jgi:hypothetical protein